MNGYTIRYIINTYPLQFDLLRQQQPSAKVFSCGIHPWYTDNEETQFAKLRELAQESKDIVAVGEIGLDKLRGSDLRAQAGIFIKQAHLAEELERPVIIHCVKAWDELIAVKKEIKPQQTWIVHGFRGGEDLAQQLLSHGFKLSFGQSFNADTVRSVPQSSLFLETDDSPSSIYTIYSEIAKTLNLNIGELVNIINKNVRETFRLAVKTAL